VDKASDVWLVAASAEAARHLMWNDGFYTYEAEASRP
jgi:hypothetical protein